MANIMIISVLERRSEIGLRRALGATKGHIRIQFLAEAVLLALLGGAVGVGIGVLATAVYASSKHELVVIPALAWAGGMGAAIIIGAVAGLWPALPRRPDVTHSGAVEHVSGMHSWDGGGWRSQKLKISGAEIVQICRVKDTLFRKRKAAGVTSITGWRAPHQSDLRRASSTELRGMRSATRAGRAKLRRVAQLGVA